MNALKRERGSTFTRKLSDLSYAERLALQGDDAIAKYLESLSDAEVLEFMYDWRIWGRPKQLPPPGDWSTWSVRAGRGWGKTRTGSQWTHERAMAFPHWLALIGKTPADVRDVMIEGPGGLCDRPGKNIKPSERPKFESSKRRVTWPNGSWATIYSSEEPDQLRGFSGATAWMDELAKYDNPEQVWDNLAFGMRECTSDRPRKLITSTPRPIAIITQIESMKSAVTTVGSSYENQANLDPTFFAELARYEGTAFGRQEIHAEILDIEETGIVKRSWFKLWPHDKPLPAFEYIIVSVDTAFTELTYDKDTHSPDPTACDVFGLFHVAGKPRIMHLDSWEEHYGFPDLIKRLRKEMEVAYGPIEKPLLKPLVGSGLASGQGHLPDLLILEDKGAGISARQTLAREGLHAYAYNPGKLSKLTRLHLVSHLFHDGFVYLVESDDPARRGKHRTWAEKALTQLCSFQGEGSIAHDDHVDTFTQALRVMLDMHLLSVSDPVTEEDRDLARAQSAYGRPLIGTRDNPYGA